MRAAPVAHFTQTELIHLAPLVAPPLEDVQAWASRHATIESEDIRETPMRQSNPYVLNLQ